MMVLGRTLSNSLQGLLCFDMVLECKAIRLQPADGLHLCTCVASKFVIATFCF
jgi:hypothetical protein